MGIVGSEYGESSTFFCNQKITEKEQVSAMIIFDQRQLLLACFVFTATLAHSTFEISRQLQLISATSTTTKKIERAGKFSGKNIAAINVL